MKKRLSLYFVLALMSVLLTIPPVFAASETVGVHGITNIFEAATAYSVVVIGAMGILAFLVSMFVEVTKRLPFLAKIPTDLQVIITSVILCEYILFAYSSWKLIALQWYYIVLAFGMSLAVSFVAMFGWTKIYALYIRFTKFKV